MTDNQESLNKAKRKLTRSDSLCHLVSNIYPIKAITNMYACQKSTAGSDTICLRGQLVSSKFQIDIINIKEFLSVDRILTKPP